MKQHKPVYILLADDDEDDTSLFKEALEQIQILARLDVAENGMELMNMLLNGQNAPDLIFLDMNMPVKNGLECLVEIKTSENFKEVPVVILSTSVADYLLESAYNAGANLYIQKPTSFTGLIEIIKRCLVERDGFKSPGGLEQFLIKNSIN